MPLGPAPSACLSPTNLSSHQACPVILSGTRLAGSGGKATWMNRKTVEGDLSPAHRLPGTPFSSPVCVGERPVSSEVISAVPCPFSCGHLCLITLHLLLSPEPAVPPCDVNAGAALPVAFLPQPMCTDVSSLLPVTSAVRTYIKRLEPSSGAVRLPRHQTPGNWDFSGDL